MGALQEWLWNGQKRWKEEIEREELDQYQNTQLVFFNYDPVPRLGFLPTGDQLLYAPIRSVLWLREEKFKLSGGADHIATKVRCIFPVPPKSQCEFLGGWKALRTVSIHDHWLDTFQDFVQQLAEGDQQEKSLAAVNYVSPQEFLSWIGASR